MWPFSLLTTLASKLIGYAVAAVAAFVLGWYLWTSFTEKISAAAVEENNQQWAVQYNQQASDLKAMGQQFLDLRDQVVKDREEINRQTAEKLKKEQDRAIAAEKKYKAELLAKNEATAKLAKSEAAVDKLRADSLPRLTQAIATRDGDGEQVGRLREYADGLGEILGRCQQTVANLRRGCAAAVDRLGSAEAAARALNPISE